MGADIAAAASAIDVTALEVQLLTAFGIALLAVATAAATRLASWLKIKNTAGQQQAFEAAADAALEYGIARANAMILSRGWDHVTVKNEVLETAARYAVKNFSAILSVYGINVEHRNGDQDKLTTLLERRFSGAISKASASPATPPVDEKPTLATNAGAAAIP